MEEIICTICKTKFTIAPYGDGECPLCFQEYNYDEGHSIVLDDKQIEILADGRD